MIYLEMNLTFDESVLSNNETKHNYTVQYSMYPLTLRLPLVAIVIIKMCN